MRLLVVANRAPIRKTDTGWSPSIGGLATALLPVLEEQGGVWVSMGEAPDLPERQPYPADDPNFHVRRVPLTQETLDNYYYGMSNRVLWPLSHYMIEHMELNDAFYTDYQDVNRRFAEAVVEEAQEGDQVWVQDYHLMLAPAFIRTDWPEATIGHFWHIPWPAMEVFRILPRARDLLRGMLGCDLIGFHVEEYVNNFIESAHVLLGAEVEGNIIHWEGREVRVEAHPLGIDTARFQRMTDEEETQEAVQNLREETGTEHLVLGIDRMDYTKGILKRLLAFETFLEDHPDAHKRVSFYQIATPSRTKLETYQQMKREVDEAVGRINGQYGTDTWVPVHYRYRKYTQRELCAFYNAANVCFITPLRDGMNLVAQEYVTSNTDGVLVLSELTGASYVLEGAVKVNPYDHNALADAIRAAIEMPREERQQRLGRLKEATHRLDVHRWADRFLQAMDEVAAT